MSEKINQDNCFLENSADVKDSGGNQFTGNSAATKTHSNYLNGLCLANIEPQKLYNAEQTFYLLKGSPSNSPAQRSQQLFAFRRKGLVAIKITKESKYQGSDILAFIENNKEVRR